MLKSLLPYDSNFPDYLTEYIEQIYNAIKNNQHHDNRRQLFINFLRLGFKVDPVEIELERKIKVAQVRGRIDAFFKSIIFEFKTDLEKEQPAAIIELKKYFEAQTNPSDYVALVTDGLSFEGYQYENRVLMRICEFTLSNTDVLAAFRYLDQFIFSSNPVTPKSFDIIQRFGLRSAVFNSSRLLLLEMYQEVKSDRAVKVKNKEWNSLLARVYGTELGDVPLFIRHTYLTMFSRLLVANTLFPGQIRTTKDYKGLLTGEYFKRHNLPNLVEPDFFSWALETSEEGNFIGFLAKLDGYFSIYNLKDLSEDVLKELYQELVDPESRHSLGEYYTPDWLAELTLNTIQYKKGTLLDPACGSGTFLFKAIQSLRQNGLKGTHLLETVLSSIIGLDVHPLAIIMAKANMLLALNEEVKHYHKEICLQVYLSDTLLVAEDVQKKCIFIAVSKTEKFFIPLITIESQTNLDKLIDKLSSFAQKVAQGIDIDKAFSGLERTVFSGFSEEELFYWRHNFRLMAKLIKQKRNSIWSFILKNAYRPVFLRLSKVDYIVGNPPWLSYRYIKDDAYKARVKELTFSLSLLQKTEVKLFTQMDTSTIFFNYCEKEFLKPDGTIAFVMPKTTILPAKQHIAFQESGFTEIIDLSGVTPLFNVRAVVLVRKNKEGAIANIPITYYEGKLSYKNLVWDTAQKYISSEKDTYSFLDIQVKSSFYYQQFFQGATIVPRCFWFVQPQKDAAKHEDAPFLQTNDEALKEAKDPWKIVYKGRVEKKFIFEAVLAKGLLPFCIARRELIFLPVKILDSKIELVDVSHLLSEGKEYAAQWLHDAENMWNENRSSEARSIYQRLDYNKTLTNQHPKAKQIVVYNTSGTNLTAALLLAQKRHCIIDAKTYYYYPKSIEEGDYLCSILNSDIVNERIKAYQPEGLYGARDIHRRPFEVCPIPEYDDSNSDHKRLAVLGCECRNTMEQTASKMMGRLGLVRLAVRKILLHQLTEINKIVTSILLEHGQDSSPSLRRKRKSSEPGLF